MFTRYAAVAALVASALTLGLQQAGADTEAPMEYEVVLKLGTRTVDGDRTKIKAKGILEHHADDGDFTITATDKKGQTVTLAGNLVSGAKMSNGIATLTVGAGAPVQNVNVWGAFKHEGSMLKAALIVVDTANGNAVTTGSVKAKMDMHDDEHGDEH